MDVSVRLWGARSKEGRQKNDFSEIKKTLKNSLPEEPEKEVLKSINVSILEYKQ